jgi:3-hydroxyisobutyrate dehydrogenase-like beta-hydroxyacid dehydrogenase
MARIAFLGIGRMGAPMAGRLVAAGHELTVWSRTRKHAEVLAERTQPESRVSSAFLRRYAALATSASRGAVLRKI